MTNHNDDNGDKVNTRTQSRDDRKGNEAIRFAAFYHEWIRQNTSATMAEARAAYAAQEG